MSERMPIRAPQEGITDTRAAALETIGAIVMASLDEARQAGRSTAIPQETIFGYPWSAQPVGKVPSSSRVPHGNLGDGVGLDI